MLPEERRRHIVELVDEAGGRSDEELAEELDVSKATIRRDLDELESMGHVNRSHGGAVPVPSVGAEESYTNKEIQHFERKRAIGERAVEEIRDEEIVFFDGGTTTLQAAKCAPEDRSFVAVTNAPPLTGELLSRAGNVKLTGGTLRAKTRTLVGPTAEHFMDQKYFDLVLLGTNGIHGSVGLTTPNEATAKMKSLMVEHSQRVVLLADSSKFGECSFSRFARVGEIDTLITDAGPPDSLERALDDAEVTVIEVDVT